jgi:FkbH-like protein
MTDKLIKCVVWDLDDTLWSGTLLAGPVEAREQMLTLLRQLDERGILQSIASRNDPELALKKLEELGVAEYFLTPQISFGAKSDAVRRIAEGLNIGLDSVALVDDQAFERGEVAFSLPSVRCYDPANPEELGQLLRLVPDQVTEESRNRRRLYQVDALRKESEASFQGPKEDFLRTLDLSLIIERPSVEDLGRLEDLTLRTHQLNATGYTYSLEELRAFRSSSSHRLYMATLTDRFGSYGRIGLSLLQTTPKEWRMKLLLMSCRTLSRGVGNVFLRELLALAKPLGVRFVGEFVPTDRNRLMYIAYKFAGFRDVEGSSHATLLEHDLTSLPERPPFWRIEVRP